MFQGTHTALITPFRNGEVDTDAFRALIDRQVKGGVDGIVPCGTTGESPTLGRKEHLRVIELAVEYAAGRIKVIAGTGANATSEATNRVSPPSPSTTRTCWSSNSNGITLLMGQAPFSAARRERIP